jgi:hypothetical protein
MPTDVDSGGRAVLLCCAAEDRFALAPAVERLLRVSVESTFVSGIVKDPGLFNQALGKYRAGAFYVLCRSKHLDRMRTTKFQMLLIRQGIPEDLIVSVQVLNERPESVSNPVIEHIKQFGKKASAPQAPASPNAWPEDADVEEDDALTTPFRLQDIVNEPDAKPAGPPATPPPAPVAQKTTPSQQVLASSSPSVGGPAEPPPYAFDDGLEAIKPKKTGLIAALVGGGLLVAGGAVFLAMSGGDDQAAESAGVADVSQGSGAPKPPPAAAQPSPEPEPGPVPQAEAADGPAAQPAPQAQPQPQAEAAPPPAAGGAGEPAVLAALQRGEIRALDSILYAAAVSRYDDYPGATEYCAGLNVGGVTGWRLASSTELRALVKPKLIKRARYWTNKTSGKRSAMLFEGKSKRTKKKKQSYKGGRALCVRDWGQPSE